jgi:hypothetical protein
VSKKTRVIKLNRKKKQYITFDIPSKQASTKPSKAAGEKSSQKKKQRRL